MNLNVGSQFQPLLARQLPSQQEFDAWTDQQARLYGAAYFDHASTAHLKQTLLANQLFDAQMGIAAMLKAALISSRLTRIMPTLVS